MPRAERSRAARACATIAVAASAWAAIPRAARAADLPPVGGTPVRLDVTQTAVFAYHANNRDKFIDNDDYSEWINRLGGKLTWGRWSAGLRLDSAVYFKPPNAEYLARKDVDETFQPDPLDPDWNQRKAYDVALTRYRKDLANRYQSTVYPSKAWLTYTGRDVELTAGDFYAHFGRGLVLSVRKLDEFAYDNTIRGMKLDWTRREGGGRVGATLLAGYANPVRVDEITARRLVAPYSGLFAGMPRPERQHAVEGLPAGASATREQFPIEERPNFIPDGIAGLRFEGGTNDVLLGFYGSLLARNGLEGDTERAGVDSQRSPRPLVDPAVLGGSPMPHRNAKFIETASTSLSLPTLGGIGAAYVETAVQRLDPGPTVLRAPDDASKNHDGYAAYGSLSLGGDPVIALLEVRHTRRFWPLVGNVDLRTANEFFGLQWSAPPTTNPIVWDSELNNFATCTTGGRARVDWKMTGDVILFGAVGRYASWAERFTECDADGKGLRDKDRNDVWDPFVGLTVTYDRKRSRAHAWTGIRNDQMAEPERLADGTTGTTFYRESWVRWDWMHSLWPGLAVQVQGLHRSRAEPAADKLPWSEGENYAAVHIASKVIAAAGYEFTTRFGSRLDYYNGSIFYRLPKDWLSQDSNVRLFVGQQRGALRCISGVCKKFPDFAGAKVELVVRF